MNSLTLLRNGVKVFPTALLSNDIIEAGREARQQFELWSPLIQRTDAMACTGTLDFGPHYSVKLPECNYYGEAMSANPPRWLTHCMIDATVIDGVTTKPSSTPGILIGRYAKFEGMSFGGACWNKDEDGGLIGFSAPEDSTAEFWNCDIDASGGHDWGIYSWANFKRTLVIKGGTLKFCRLGVAMAASGAAAQQTVTLEGVKLIGDANGSTSYGESSGGDVNKGGVLTAVLNRSGSTVMRDCSVDAVGLAKPYNGKWGCPRIAALATNQYYSGAGATSFTIERCRSKITPGTAQAWYDVDVRGSGKLSVVPLKVWTP